MPNPEHVALLKRLVPAKNGMGHWNLWRQDNPHVLPDFQEADLWRENISLFDFSSANLSHADLRGANLCSANLTHANLSNARLHLAHLRGATLTGANLKEAELYDADLTFATLTGAQLISAHLQAANFTMAKLAQADFSRCVLGHTIFGSNDFDEVIGLETVVHQYRSVIGLDTFYRSRNRIPESFLRGCGVSEEFIHYLPSLLDQPIQFLLHQLRPRGQGVRPIAA